MQTLQDAPILQSAHATQNYSKSCD